MIDTRRLAKEITAQVAHDCQLLKPGDLIPTSTRLYVQRQLDKVVAHCIDQVLDCRGGGDAHVVLDEAVKRIEGDPDAYRG